MALRGALPTGQRPLPGATPAFTLRLTTRSLFHKGLVGVLGMTTSAQVTIDSYAVPAPAAAGEAVAIDTTGGPAVATEGSLAVADAPDFIAEGLSVTAAENLAFVESSDGVTVTRWDNFDTAFTPSSCTRMGSYLFGRSGHVFTNGKLTLGSRTRVYGDASAGSFQIAADAVITGRRTLLSSLESFMLPEVPAGIPELGTIHVLPGASQVIVGPGSFKVSNLTVGKRGRLHIDNAAGPVTLYVTGAVTLNLGGTVTTADRNPEKFAIYVVGTGGVSLGNASVFSGLLYAPLSSVTLGGGGEFFGAFLGRNVSLESNTRVHFAETLR